MPLGVSVSVVHEPQRGPRRRGEARTGRAERHRGRQGQGNAALDTRLATCTPRPFGLRHSSSTRAWRSTRERRHHGDEPEDLVTDDEIGDLSTDGLDDREGPFIGTSWRSDGTGVTPPI